MVRRPALSRGETEVARAVWELSEASVGQVFEHLTQSREIDYTTVQTYIRRLESKGYITSRRVGRNKLYSPKVRPGQVIGEAIDDLMNRLFDGEVLPLMRHLINDRGIDSDDLQALRQLLETADQERPEEDPDG